MKIIKLKKESEIKKDNPLKQLAEGSWLDAEIILEPLGKEPERRCKAKIRIINI